jgi:DNA polymerase I-like protein with 3'-5' exonuclease and polymerase domains
MPIFGVVDDTMLRAWEAHPEMEKGLGFLASCYTKEPYWKDKRDHEDKAERLLYNGKDSAVTYEINSAIKLTPQANEHYQFNINILTPTLYMQMRGLRWDKDGASDARHKIELDRISLQAEIDTIAKHPVNVESPKQMCNFLYNELKLPPQYKENAKGEQVITADALSLLKLFQLEPNPILRTILRVRAAHSKLETLSIGIDNDGRIRCGYNVVGSKTGRLACYESPTGSGMNLQTVTKKLRYLVIADPDCFIAQCDLAGADGWTVAAECKMLGDPTMYDDYMSGLKPARLTALMYNGVDVHSKTRAELKLLSKTIDSDGWLYFTCKRIQHATNYGTTPKTIVEQVIKDSYKLSGDPIFITEAVASRLQHLYLSRYPGVPNQQRYLVTQIQTRGFLDCASGHRRRFFGRRDSHDTHKEAFAQHPQNTTTYVTNLAIWNLWCDPNNRNGDRLRIEPLHQVHDAAITQFFRDYVDHALPAIRGYFNNPISIAGTEIVIPFEGKYGPTWDEPPAVWEGKQQATLKTI